MANLNLQDYFEYPKPVNVYPHQIDFLRFGLKRYASREGFVCGDAVGIGKTKEGIYLIGLLKCRRSLIVAPKSTAFQWLREALSSLVGWEIYFGNKSSAQHASINGIHVSLGESIPMDFLINRWANVLIVTTYHAIVPYPEVRDRYVGGVTVDAKEVELSEPLTNYIPELTPMNWFEWDMIIADEAHTLRNGVTIAMERKKAKPKTLKFARLMRLKLSPIGIKIASTGTPLQNRKSDLISLFKWLGIFLPVKIDDRWIESAVAKHVFRRTGNDLHPKLRELINFPKDKPITTNIEVIYKTQEEQQFFELACGKIVDMYRGHGNLMETEYRDIQAEENPLVKINMLRYLSASIDMYIRIHNQRHIDYYLPMWTRGESKVEMIRDLLYEMASQNRSTICFIHFYEEADRIEASLRDYEHLLGENLGFRIFRLNGESTAEQRDVILARTKDYLEHGQRCLVFANVLSSAEGLNMQHFNEAIFASADWNPKLEEQAEGRINRIGQKRQVYIWRFRHKALDTLHDAIDNIDAFMEGTKEEKLEIFENIFTGKPNAALFAERMDMPGFPGEKAVHFELEDFVMPDFTRMTLEEMRDYTEPAIADGTNPYANPGRVFVPNTREYVPPPVHPDLAAAQQVGLIQQIPEPVRGTNSYFAQHHVQVAHQRNNPPLYPMNAYPQNNYPHPPSPHNYPQNNYQQNNHQQSPNSPMNYQQPPNSPMNSYPHNYQQPPNSPHTNSYLLQQIPTVNNQSPNSPHNNPYLSQQVPTVNIQNTNPYIRNDVPNFLNNIPNIHQNVNSSQSQQSTNPYVNPVPVTSSTPGRTLSPNSIREHRARYFENIAKK